MDIKVKRTFDALFLLEDLREIWRKTAPFHELADEQKAKVKNILAELRKCLEDIEGMERQVSEELYFEADIPVRIKEENYVNIHPIQRGGVLTSAARKALISYGDGYSTCDYCLPPKRLDKIRKPKIDEFHAELAEFLGMDQARVVPGARRGFQVAFSSLIEKEDYVLVEGLAHYSMYLAIEQQGGNVAEVPHSGYPEYKIDPENYAQKIEMVKEKTGKYPKLVTLSHVDYLYGNLHDARKIGKIAHEYNIPFLLNAAYTVGVMPVNGKELNADIIVSSGHKSFASPAPSGIIATTDEYAERLFRITKIKGNITGRTFGIKEIELLGCTLMGAPMIAMIASFPYIKERVKYWDEEIKKIRYLIEQLERIEGTRQLGIKPKQHTLTHIESDGFYKISKSHKRRGFFLYKELKDRRVFGIEPGLTKHFKLNTYGLTWSQVRYVAEVFIDVAEKYRLNVK